MVTTSQRYEKWYGTPAGAYTFGRNLELVRRLVSVWPRRGSTLLGMNVGSGLYLEALWEAGFDVTGQERDPALMARARERLGSRADFVLSPASHLPFDDESFDYTVAVAALEFTLDPEDAFREMARLARKGMLIVFPNAFSLYFLECCVLPLFFEKIRLKKSRLASCGPACLAEGQVWLNPLTVRRMARKVVGDKRITWSSVLLGPSGTWKPGKMQDKINRALPSLPLGAFVGMRVDFGPQVTGTGLPLKAVKPVATVPTR